MRGEMEVKLLNYFDTFSKGYAKKISGSGG
jgi:hypothetical protein